MTQITREQFDEAVEAVWNEMRYQNAKPGLREPAGVLGWLALGQLYLHRTMEFVRTNTKESEHGLRKLAAILVRGMISTEIRHRPVHEIGVAVVSDDLSDAPPEPLDPVCTSDDGPGPEDRPESYQTDPQEDAPENQPQE